MTVEQSLRRRGTQSILWVKPLAAMSRFALLAATVEMMPGSDCA
jgi:hypothetical protein